MLSALKYIYNCHICIVHSNFWPIRSNHLCRCLLFEPASKSISSMREESYLMALPSTSAVARNIYAGVVVVRPILALVLLCKVLVSKSAKLASSELMIFDGSSSMIEFSILTKSSCFVTFYFVSSIYTSSLSRESKSSFAKWSRPGALS